MGSVAMLAAVTGVFAVRAGVVESTDAETGYKVLTVEAGDFATYSTVLDASVPGIIKRGAGTAWLTGANSAFVGPIQIEEGVLGANSGAFGNTGNLTILSGATLDVSSQPDSGMNTRKVFFEGDGLAGIGAIICTNGSNRDSMFKNVEMTGDGSWGGSKRFGMKYGTFTMNGHTLTKNTSGTMSFFNTVASPGHIVMKKGELLAQDGAKLNGSDANTLTLDGGTLNMWCLNYNTMKIDWTLLAKGSATMKAGGYHAERTGYNQYSGPIVIEGSQLKIQMDSNSRKLSLTGPITTAPGATGALYKTGGGTGGMTWIMNDAQLGSVTVDKGELHFVDAYVTVSNAYTYVNGATSADVPIMTLTNVTWVAHPQPSGKYGKERNPNQITVGSSANKWGLLKVYNDTTITNDISVGYSSGIGAIHQSGARSKVYTRATTSNDGYVGNGAGGYGYWGLTDGTVEVYAHTSVGLSANSVGYIVLHGGLFKMLNSSWKFSKGGHSELYVTGGGTFDGGTSFTFGSQDYSTTTGGKAVVTVDGEGSLANLRGATYFQWRTNFWSQINVRNGGTVQLKNLIARFSKGLAQEGLSESFISFDGGVVRLASDAANVFDTATSHDYDPTAVVVYSGGATIETEAANAVWTAPLVRPSGQSITSITLPSDVLSSTKALGPQLIEITGNGHGATAIVDYEDATQRTKGVIVTSPGYGYDNETAVTVEAWDRKSKISCTYTLGEVVGGGFTKAGGGKLTLKGANTYAGGTTVAGGTLAFGDVNGFPGGDLAVSNGASVVFAAAATTVGRFSGSGAVSGADVTVTNAVRATCADIFENKHVTFGGSLTFAEGAVFEITDPENLDTYAHSGSKPAFTAVTVNGTPTLRIEGGYDGLAKWALFKKDAGTYNFGAVVGTMLLLK